MNHKRRRDEVGDEQDQHTLQNKAKMRTIRGYFRQVKRQTSSKWNVKTSDDDAPGPAEISGSSERDVEAFDDVAPETTGSRNRNVKPTDDEIAEPAQPSSGETATTSFASTVGTTPFTSFSTDVNPAASVNTSATSLTSIARRSDQTSQSYGTTTASQDIEMVWMADEAEHAKIPALMHFNMPDVFSHLDFRTQWEVMRVLQASKKGLRYLLEDWQQPWDLPGLYALLSDRGIRFEKSEDPKALPETEICYYSAKLEFGRSNPGPMFKPKWQPARKLRSSHLARLLGAERILYLELPDVSRKETYEHVWSKRSVAEKLQKYLGEPLELFGKTWYTYFSQPIKGDAAGGTRLLMISCESADEYASTMDRLLPLKENGGKPACKAFMRLEIPLSRTIEIATFSPEEIEYNINDVMATDEDDDPEFDDPAMTSPKAEYDPTVVMNDGCNRIHHWIVQQYLLKTRDESASCTAFQARIAGAKGLWFVERPADGSVEIRNPQGTIISISKSQVKTLHASLNGLDKHDLTFAVIKTNTPPEPSILYQGFLPILFDRGVPREVLCDMVATQVEEDVNEMIEALKSGDTRDLRSWQESQNASYERMHREQGIDLIGDFPSSIEEKVIEMLESGFTPSGPGGNQYCAQKVKELIKTHFENYRTRLKIPLEQSTSLWGVPDEKGYLAPGEIHVSFSKPVAKRNGFPSSSDLNGMTGLVARNPALAPWDIQKVKIVFKPELMFAKDVIVFPTRGRRPLASKLQGGDYDGDTFWLTWDPRLTSHFKNREPPTSPPSPRSLGITVDERTLGSYFGNDPQLRPRDWQWFATEKALRRTKENLLGQVTKDHERLTYQEQGIESDEALILVHLHDYLVDADKQGYDFDQAAYDKFKAERKIPRRMRNPVYWDFTNPKQAGRTPVSKPDGELHIMDEFYLLMDPIIEEAMRTMEKILGTSESNSTDNKVDEDLAAFFNDTMQSGSVLIRDELKALEMGINSIRIAWGQKMASQKTPWQWGEYVAAVTELRKSYAAIQPVNRQHATVVEWLRRQGQSLNTWDKLKASCLAANSRNPGNMVFAIAGDKLCDLKLSARFGSHERRAMQMRFYCDLKLRSRKLKKRGLFLDDIDDNAVEDAKDNANEDIDDDAAGTIDGEVVRHVDDTSDSDDGAFEPLNRDCFG